MAGPTREELEATRDRLRRLLRSGVTEISDADSRVKRDLKVIAAQLGEVDNAIADLDERPPMIRQILTYGRKGL